MIAEAMSSFFFYFISFASLLAAVGVVRTKGILRSAIGLMVVLTLSAGFYLLLGAEFMAGVQILVYVGGVVVLMVFAIMLTGAREEIGGRPQKKLMAMLGSTLFFVVSSLAILGTNFPLSQEKVAVLPGVKAIGLSLLSFNEGGYVVPFEIISLLLLAVLIGGVVIAKKESGARGGQ